jgi:hypothetical protein
MRVDIEVRTEEYTIREVREDNDWDIGETGLNVLGVTLTPTSREYADEVDGAPGDSAVVLVEHYSDGCTFGSSEYVNVKGIFKSMPDAEAFTRLINTDHGYFGNHIDFLYFPVVLP